MPLFSPIPTTLRARSERRRQLAAALAGAALAISCASALLVGGTHNALAEGDVPIISEQPGASGGEQGGIIVNPLPNNPDPSPAPAPSPAPTLIASRADIPALAPGQQAEVVTSITDMTPRISQAIGPVRPNLPDWNAPWPGPRPATAPKFWW